MKKACAAWNLDPHICVCIDVNAFLYSSSKISYALTLLRSRRPYFSCSWRISLYFLFINASVYAYERIGRPFPIQERIFFYHSELELHRILTPPPTSPPLPASSHNPWCLCLGKWFKATTKESVEIPCTSACGLNSISVTTTSSS